MKVICGWGFLHSLTFTTSHPYIYIHLIDLKNNLLTIRGPSQQHQPLNLKHLWCRMYPSRFGSAKGYQPLEEDFKLRRGHCWKVRRIGRIFDFKSLTFSAGCVFHIYIYIYYALLAIPKLPKMAEINIVA